MISGLKIYLDETALEYISDINESFFNLDAKPFKPKAKDAGPTQGPAIDFGFMKQKSIDEAGKTPEEIEQLNLLEKKRQISQMYQYYNYLIFEKNKESFNDINPDLRKMTYKYDNEVKNAYMTVQASPEVIKAAMGMNIATQNNHSVKGKLSSPKTSTAPPPGTQSVSDLILDDDKKRMSDHKTIRYSKDQILKIYKQ